MLTCNFLTLLEHSGRVFLCGYCIDGKDGFFYIFLENDVAKWSHSRIIGGRGGNWYIFLPQTVDFTRLNDSTGIEYRVC